MLITFPPTPARFANSLRSEVEDLTKSGQVPQVRGEFTQWTHAVKYWLARKARELKLYPIYTDGQGTREFMLDLVWWQEGIGGSAILGCEIEWGNSRDICRNPARVAEDFDKLLSFKAPLKLMIFDSYSNIQTQSAVLAELNRYFREYGDHRAGEQYLIMDMSPLKNDWYCKIMSDGEDSRLHFDPLNSAVHKTVISIE
jgi:hypothetical protein